jgi:hypothetical protein
VRNWVVTGASTLGFGGVGALTEWKIAAALLVFLLVCVVGTIGFMLWLFGKERVGNWVSRHVA